MTFKAARCPTCGGDLQVPDDRIAVKCMYCGGEVVVREVIRLAAGRVKEFTIATAIEKVEAESPPVSVEQAKNRIYTILFTVVGLGVFVGLCAGGAFGVITVVTTIVVGIIMAAIHLPQIKRLEQANEKMIKRPPPKKVLLGYEGHCPYCDTDTILPPNVPGADCPACQKRIIIRDSKFFSVDTAISGIRLSE